MVDSVREPIDQIVDLGKILSRGFPPLPIPTFLWSHCFREIDSRRGGEWALCGSIPKQRPGVTGEENGKDGRPYRLVLEPEPGRVRLSGRAFRKDN